MWPAGLAVRINFLHAVVRKNIEDIRLSAFASLGLSFPLSVALSRKNAILQNRSMIFKIGFT